MSIKTTRKQDLLAKTQRKRPRLPPRCGSAYWDMPEQAGFKKPPPPALSTRFGGNGTVVFFGLAKPVRTPLIGPPRQP